MPGISFWGRPWLDGAKDHYQDNEGPDDPECLGCGETFPASELDEGLCPKCYESSELCGECGDLLDPNNSENGRCGPCLLAEHTRLDESPDDHDRRFSDLYDTLNGDIGDHAIDPDEPPF